jgi:hypothetical protein
MEEGRHGSIRLKSMNTPLQKNGKIEVKGLVAKITPCWPHNVGCSAPPFKEIQSRADTITPVLKQILENCPSQRGIY